MNVPPAARALGTFLHGRTLFGFGAADQIACTQGTGKAQGGWMEIAKKKERKAPLPHGNRSLAVGYLGRAQRSALRKSETARNMATMFSTGTLA